MKIFELNKDALRKAWSSAEQYWFSLQDYKIKDASTLAEIERPESVSNSAYYVSLGYIPYVTVSNVEVMRAFAQTISNKKLKENLAKISDEEYVEAFWKYLNVYPELSNGYNDFEDTYVLEKAKAWCEENAIEYSL